MKNSQKIFLFVVLFSAFYLVLRTSGIFFYYDVELFVANLGGLTYLYSTVGIIFALFAAFVILSESERWNSLTNAVKGEVAELNELYLWSQHFPEDLKKTFKKDILFYLDSLLKDEWNSKNNKKEATDKSLTLLHEDTYRVLKEAPELMEHTFSIFSNIIKRREERVHYVSFRLPKILRNTFICSDVLMVFLSLLIGVKSFWLDYIFLTCIAVLGYSIYLVVDDLDNPTRPGSWHISAQDYQALFDKISQEK